MKNYQILVGKRKRVNLQQVVAFVGSINYSFVHMHDGTVYMVAATLKKIETRLLPNTFFRTHKSFLINLQFVNTYDKKKLRYAEMDNKLKVTISRRRRAVFLESMESINV